MTKRLLWTAASALAAVGCLEGASELPLGEPTTGFLRVNVSTTGPNIDADGYRVGVDEGNSVNVGPNESVTLGPLAPAQYQVTIDEVAGNCAVQGGASRLVSVVAGDTVEEAFSVVCS